MAPLTELSANLPVKPKKVSSNIASITSAKWHPSGLLQGGNVSSLSTAPAIHSMLKNTTEVGDIGQLVTRPPKPTRYKIGNTVHPPRAHHQHRYADYATDDHFFQQRRYQNLHSQRHHPPRHDRSLQTAESHSGVSISDSPDQRSNSVTRSSNNSHRVLLYPPLLNIRPYRHVGPRPRSPYTYPSRLKRHGCRPSSPGHSEIHVSDSALHTTFHRAFSTPTESPSSSMRRAPQAWNHGFNRSDPLLQYYPALPLSRRHDINRSPPLLRRAALPGSLLPSNRSSFVGTSKNTKASDSSSSGERAAFAPPLFYDYSEAFEKESFHHTARRSSMFESRHIPQSDGSSEGYQADVTNTSNTSTKCSSSSTESKEATLGRAGAQAKLPSPLRLVSRIMKQQPTKYNKASVDISSESSISNEVVISPLDDATITKDLHKNDVVSTQISELVAAKVKMADLTIKSSATHGNLQRPQAIYDAAPKVFKTAKITMRLSSSSSGSQYSSSAHSRPDKTSGLAAIKAPEVAYERQPKALSVSFNRFATVRHELEGGEPQQRAASLDTHSRPEPFQIFSPLPERSMSSRDSRDRFSRILSLGDDFGKRDLDMLPNKKAPITIQQYLRDRKAPLQKAKASITKELPPLPDDPSPVIDKGKGKEKESGQLHNEYYTTGHFASDKQPIKEDIDTNIVGGLDYLSALTGIERPGIPPRYSSISRNSMIDLPESSRSVRESIASQNRGNEDCPRRFALKPRNSSLFQTMKELPELPKEIGFPMIPLSTPTPLGLPYSFTTLMPQGVDTLLESRRIDTRQPAIADIPDSLKAEHRQPEGNVGTEIEEAQQTPSRRFNVGVCCDDGSNSSPASARPWNLDASYPWGGSPPKLEVSIPQSAENPETDPEELPRFRFNVYRSSVLRTGGKLLKPRPTGTSVVPPSAAGRKIVPVRTRFREGFANAEDGPPIISLMPPSPGLQMRAQSFFSDDSSLKRRKGSLRRRLSQIRGAIRTTSSEDIRWPDRANHTSTLSRASKSSSKPSSTAPEDGTLRKPTTWKMLEKIKSWYHRKEGKMRKWRRKLIARYYRNRAVGAGFDAGV
ncbi:MAG: hypothetical protein Q9170_003487 [Blastenia crenularia]